MNEFKKTMLNKIKNSFEDFNIENYDYFICLKCKIKIFSGCSGKALKKFIKKHNSHKLLYFKPMDKQIIDISEFRDITTKTDIELFKKDILNFFIKYGSEFPHL